MAYLQDGQPSDALECLLSHMGQTPVQCGECMGDGQVEEYGAPSWYGDARANGRVYRCPSCSGDGQVPALNELGRLQAERRGALAGIRR